MNSEKPKNLEKRRPHSQSVRSVWLLVLFLIYVLLTVACMVGAFHPSLDAIVNALTVCNVVLYMGILFFALCCKIHPGVRIPIVCVLLLWGAYAVYIVRTME